MSLADQPANLADELLRCRPLRGAQRLFGLTRCGRLLGQLRFSLGLCGGCLACRLQLALALVAGSLLFHGKTVRRLLPAIERLIYFAKLPRKLLRSPAAGAPKPELVQIGAQAQAGRHDDPGPQAG